MDDHVTLDLADFLKVHFACKTCGVGISFPVAKWSRIPLACPGCNADWVYPETPPHQTLQQLATAFRALVDSAEKPVGYRLSFEVVRLSTPL